MSAYIHLNVKEGDPLAERVVVLNQNTGEKVLLPNGRGHAVVDHKAIVKKENGIIHVYDRW